MPVGYEAFAHLADPQRPNAVLKLNEVQSSAGHRHELRAYARGFKRFVAYFRPEENRTVARAFAKSMRAQFGREAAAFALERNGFHRFEIHGKPLQTRRVRAVFEVAKQQQEVIRADNRALTETVTEMSAPETSHPFLRAWISHRSGPQNNVQDIDLNHIARLAQHELEELGANGTHRLNADDIYAVLGQIPLDQSQSPETESDRLSLAPGPRWADASQHTEPGANERLSSPSIDTPPDLESHVGEDGIYEEIPVAPAGREPQPGTHRAAAKSGAALEVRVLDSLYKQAKEQLNDLAGEPNEEQIRKAVEKIQFWISSTLFEAHPPHGPTPPGAYYRDALTTCWEYLVERCNKEGMPKVAEHIEAYDRARMESLYRSIQHTLGRVVAPRGHPESLARSGEALEPLSVSSEGLALSPGIGEDFKRQQALLTIGAEIAKEAGRARRPVPFGEVRFKAYWQSMLALDGADSTQAIARLLASPTSALRRVTEAANSFLSEWPDSQEAQHTMATGEWDRDGVCYGSLEWMAAKSWLDFMNGLARAIPTVLNRVEVPPFDTMRSEQLSPEERAMLSSLGVPVPEQRLRAPAVEEPRQDASAVAGRRLPREVSPAVESPAESTPHKRRQSVEERRPESQPPDGSNADAASDSPSSAV